MKKKKHKKKTPKLTVKRISQPGSQSTKHRKHGNLKSNQLTNRIVNKWLITKRKKKPSSLHPSHNIYDSKNRITTKQNKNKTDNDSDVNRRAKNKDMNSGID